MNQIVLTGMVLSTAPVGEYDRRVVILTKEQGKISAFARGARRPNSPLVGAVNPFSFGEFTMYEGRSSHTIQSVKITNYFSELREDMIGAYYGFYFLEFANYYTKEQNDEREMLKLLYQTMKALTSPHIPNLLIRRIFELKAYQWRGTSGLSVCPVSEKRRTDGVQCQRRRTGLYRLCQEYFRRDFVGQFHALYDAVHRDQYDREAVYIYSQQGSTGKAVRDHGTILSALCGKKVQVPGDS